MIRFLLIMNRQGKIRLSKFFQILTPKQKKNLPSQIAAMVQSRSPKDCNFIEWGSGKVIYKRYASLYFITFVDPEENELMVLEKIHFYVCILDRYFGNVCELDLVFNFHKAYFVLDEVFIGGQMQETSQRLVLKSVAAADAQSQMGDGGKTGSYRDPDVLQKQLQDVGLA